MMPLALLFTTAMAALLLATLTPRLLAVAERATSNRSAAARLAAGNLCREPRRTGVMAVALGSAVAVGVLTASFNASVRTSVNRNLTANLDGLTVSSLDPGNAANIDAKLSPETLARLATLPGVGRVDRTATVVTGHEPGKLVVARAFSHPWLEDDVLAGIQDQARLEAGEVVIGPALARQEGIRPGDQVTLDTPTGRVALPVMGVVQDGNGGGRNILLSLALMERLFGPQPSSQVVVVPQPGTSLDTLAATIRSARLDPDLRVESRQEVVDRVARNVAQQLASFAALQRGLLVMSFVAVLSTLVLVGIQRQRELGMLAAVGMTPGELARMVLYEALLVSVTAVLVELPIGIVHYAAVLLLAPILIGFKNPFVLDLGAAASYALLAVGVAVVAAGWPAWQASRVEVGPALQYE
jgi:putative ABC transport system permease protein